MIVGPSTRVIYSRIASLVINTETELIMKSRRVVPTRLLNEGFAFKFPQMKQLLRDLDQ
ncbi:DUF1731 domain-containing protein [Chryseotalea sanaruensis]|uniref:DUF1731 domain-containing protein n=1 Tax=Chryseotalea sanaruensis TaxID=2482724 RepID=UPI00351F78E3